jgi:glycosyltransferase involved in cell wall biosynthesis
MTDFKTRRGRPLTLIGDPALLTMDRLALVTDRFDSDPRIATISLVGSSSVPADPWLRATGPAGPLTVLALDVADLVGAFNPDDPETIDAWLLAASERGLWHDWLLTNHADVVKAELVCPPTEMDALELDDPSGSHHTALRSHTTRRGGITITVDVTWLGPYETGAQVLTTAAIRALGEDDRVTSITLVGAEQLPVYAQHLIHSPKVTLQPDGALPPISDVVWYPNQIDQRSNIADARALGRRVITTYLDLIAYDIPRYHGSPEAWAAYRALQRKIALSVDGITTISADVAQRLMQEVPRLDAERVLPLPLGLDHIAHANAPDAPDADLAPIVEQLKGKRFIAVLGNDFQHKNRDFAVAVWQRVLQEGQPCDLILAGLHVKSSSSKAGEEALLETHVDLRGTAHTVGHLTSASRAWLLANASVVVYPSSAEGFGFVPYEAAALGTPATFTAFGPLAEISGVTDVPRTWSIDAYAADITRLLSDEQASSQRVADLRRAIATHTWAGFADGLIMFFERITRMPTILTSTLGSSSASNSAELAAVLSSRSYRAAAKVSGILRRKK